MSNDVLSEACTAYEVRFFCLYQLLNVPLVQVIPVMVNVNASMETRTWTYTRVNGNAEM